MVLVLCALAMCRVFLFSAAFPFFNNVDESAHFDTVHKYARGFLPREAAPKFDEGAAEAIVLYASPEYTSPREDAGIGDALRPVWSFPKEETEALLPRVVKARSSQKNHEANSPPTYYVLAGFWYDLGKALGFGNGERLYWIRFLNVGIYGLLVWVSYRLCASVRPDDPTICIGVPLILAFFPQDLFYSINSDVLSPLLFAVFLYRSISSMSSDRGLWFDLVTGALVAVTFLVKPSNLVVVIVFSGLLLRRAMALRRGDEPNRRLLGLALSAVAAAVPIIVWFAWNFTMQGDLTGSASKIKMLGWTWKPVAQLWDHPIFGFAGFAGFMAELIRTFWRGELVWHQERIASPGADFVYVATSCFFVIASILGLVRDRHASDPIWWFIRTWSVGILILYVGYMAGISIVFDFGKCFYPSRESPFFTSGRLISGGLVPFLILYVDGLARILSRLPGRIHPIAVLAFSSLLMLASEICLSWQVFFSPYNWFHLP